MAFLLMAAAFTDLFTSQDAENFPEGGVIPDIYSVGGVLIAYIWAFYDGNLYDSLAGSGTGVFILLIPAVLYQLIRKREGLGLGDIFLMGMVGSFLGSYAVVWVLCAASIIGLVIGFGVLLKTKERNYRLPFAPMIAAGSLLYIFMEL
jgi:leader peptidase (prepilin peptidase)/N-methyltransferase